MGKTVIIVQTNLESIGRFQNLIQQEHPRLEKHTRYSDSFDEVLSLVPEEGELVVITCNRFNDKASSFHKLENTTIPDCFKDGVMLAKMVKEKNPNTRVYLFSKQTVEENKYLDEFTPLNPRGDMEVGDVLNVLDKIGFYPRTSFIC